MGSGCHSATCRSIGGVFFDRHAAPSFAQSCIAILCHSVVQQTNKSYYHPTSSSSSQYQHCHGRRTHGVPATSAAASTRRALVLRCRMAPEHVRHPALCRLISVEFPMFICFAVVVVVVLTFDSVESHADTKERTLLLHQHDAAIATLEKALRPYLPFIRHAFPLQPDHGAVNVQWF